MTSILAWGRNLQVTSITELGIVKNSLKVAMVPMVAMVPLMAQDIALVALMTAQRRSRGFAMTLGVRMVRLCLLVFLVAQYRS